MLVASAEALAQSLDVGTDLFGVQVLFLVTGHVLCQGKKLHFQGNSSQYYFLELVFGMARAELAGMAMHRESHDRRDHEAAIGSKPRER